MERGEEFALCQAKGLWSVKEDSLWLLWADGYTLLWQILKDRRYFRRKKSLMFWVIHSFTQLQFKISKILLKAVHNPPFSLPPHIALLSLRAAAEGTVWLLQQLIPLRAHSSQHKPHSGPLYLDTSSQKCLSTTSQPQGRSPHASEAAATLFYVFMEGKLDMLSFVPVRVGHQYTIHMLPCCNSSYSSCIKCNELTALCLAEM